MRASLLRLFVVVGLCTSAALAQEANDRARRIQASVLGVDGHNDTVQRIMFENVDIGNRLLDGAIDIPRLQEGGIHVPFFALWVPTYYKGSEAVRRTLDFRDAMQRVLDKYPDRIELATSAHDIERIVGQKKIAAVLTVEGGHQIDNDLAVLRMYRRMGIWQASGARDERHWHDRGHLARIGQDFLRCGAGNDKARHRLSFVVPFVFRCPRNMSDDMLRALAKNGGVVGVNFGAAFLNQKDAEELKQAISHENALEPNLAGAELDQFAAKEGAESGESHPHLGNATVEDAAECIDHIVKVAGIEHVGIGSDFDGTEIVPRGLEDVSKMPNLTEALLKRGYSEGDIKKIMGGNFLRVVREVVGN